MRKKILIIDDDETILQALELFFLDEGYSVVSLPQTNNIEDVVKKHSPNIILLDHLLPGKNGLELTKQLKSNNSTKNLPIIMIAADHHIQSRAKKIGINEFIAKPFELDNLLSKIKKYIN